MSHNDANEKELELWKGGDQQRAVDAMRTRTGMGLMDCREAFDLADIGETWKSLSPWSLLKRIRVLEQRQKELEQKIRRQSLYTDVIGGIQL